MKYIGMILPTLLLMAATSRGADVLQPIDLRQVKVGGEFARRIDITIKNNILKLDFEKDFIKPFQRKEMDDGGYQGLGKLIDSMARLFGSLAEMADALGKTEEATQWKTALAGLGPRAVDPQTNCVMLCPNESLTVSYPNLAHMISIYPLGLLNIDGSERDRAVIAATCKQFDGFGTSGWCGYSFTWWACLRARVGDAEAALKYLDIYEKAFILRNGFHANGDQLKAGYSLATYRPFTLEANFSASQAVHEMLLQSWDGVIRVFPATPSRWHRAAFDDLRAEGGYRVSARRENKVTTWLKVVANRDGVVRIRDNFGGRQPQWSRPKMKKVGQDWQCSLKAGEAVTLGSDRI